MTPAPAAMEPLPLPSRRAVILAGALVATAAAAAAMTPRKHERLLVGANLSDVIPQKVGPWAAIDGGPVVLPEQEGAASVYDQVLTRSFAAPGQPVVVLLIAYGGAQSGLMKVHRPNVCYETNGFKIGPLSRADLHLKDGRTVPGESFIATRSDRIEQVLFWTRIGAGFPISLDEQRWMTLQEGFKGLIPDGVLVRMSTIGADPVASRKALDTFASALVEESGSRAQTLLVGAATPSPGRKA